MQEFQVNIYPARDKSFLTSFVHPLTKRKVRQSFLSRTEALVFKEKTEVRFRKKQVENYRGLTIEELIVYFINERPKNPFTRKIGHLIDFVETFGQFKIDDITTDALKVWLDQVQRENTLKDITMRGLKCDIDTLFAFLEEKEIIGESPLRGIYYEKVTPSLKVRNLLDAGEIEKLLKSLKDYSPGYLYPIIKMFTETGGKVSDILELRWKDVDLDRRMVHYGGTDRSQERKLKISEELVEILTKKRHTSDYVFQTYYKESFTRAKLSRAINEFKAKGLFKKPWGPLDLRHSFAVNFLSADGDIHELQRILGHKDIFDTKRLYGEAVTEKVSKEICNPFE